MKKRAVIFAVFVILLFICPVSARPSIRETLNIRQIVVDDYVRQGDDLKILVDVENQGIGKFENVKVTAYVYDLDLYASRKFYNLKQNRNTREILFLEIPKNARPGVYYLRLVISDSLGNRRVKHRDFIVF